MAINRKLWKSKFTAENLPLWPCPECNDGRLLLDSKSIQEFESCESRKAQSHEAWEPNWISGTFTAHSRCNIPSCNCISALVGQYSVVENPHEWDRYITQYTPAYFRPSPPVFYIPDDCPETVADEVKASFKLVYLDPLAAANRIRASLEVLMDHVNIPRWTGRGKGKKTHLVLHKRIEKFGTETKSESLQELLTAVKWIGNEGSHGGNLDTDGLLDGYELLEFILMDIFDGTAAKLLAKSKKINKKKGSLRKTSR
jgi:Domain of unknown function (DUF4145)